MKKNVLKLSIRFFLLLFLVAPSVTSQTITVNPGASYQAVTFGGDAKLTIKNYADGNTSTVSDKLFDEMNLKILRVPIFALQPISDPIYDDVIEVINSVKAVNSNVKIFASIANGDGYGTDYHGEHKFLASWRGCCSYNVYSLNLTTYATYLDSFMTKMNNAGITIDYLGPWNEDSADDSDHHKVFDQMNNLGATKKVGLERWALSTSVADVDDVEDRTDIIGSHFYDDDILGESNWNSTWASLVNASADPVWYTESTRYSTNDNIDRLIAGLNNIFPALRSGVEAVIFYQACNRIVYANGSTPPIKYSGFKNIVNNAWGKVINSYGNDNAIKVVSFGNNSTINIHILNTSNNNKTVTINLTNGYSVSGTVTRKIWDNSNTGTSNTYTLNGSTSWNVTCPANGYTHLNIPLNKSVASKTSNDKNVIIEEDIIITSNELEIIPNPTKGNFKLNLPKITDIKEVRIKIFSLDGKEVFSEIKNYNTEIFVNKNLISGMYLLSVEAGKEVFNNKLVITN